MKATEAGKTYDMVIVCSMRWNPGYVLVNNKDYPQISDDYVRSFATLRCASNLWTAHSLEEDDPQ
jgi:metallo-beta-lactamase class B